jgi:pyruvate kinase
MVSQISKPSSESLHLSSPQGLLSTLQSLRQTVESEGKATFDKWNPHIQRTAFIDSALNLAEYLALRRHDLRPLQAALMPSGLSSLGRIEGRVMPNLDAVIATLEVICGSKSDRHFQRPPIEFFFEGDSRSERLRQRLLQQHTEELFGESSPHRRVRIMVTLDTEAATNYELVRSFIQRGANCMRINCAHDTPEIWQGAIDNIRRAEQETGTICKIMMDLGGPKIRTGAVLAPHHKKRVFKGDRIVLSRREPESAADLAKSTHIEHFQTSCTIPSILDLLAVDTPVSIDDGKIQTRVIDTQYSLAQPTVGNRQEQQGLLLEVINTSPKGVKLKPEKGLNFPDTVLDLSPLTEQDLADLDFVAVHADIIGYSFVQRPADIELLQQELNKRCENRLSPPAIVAKIETAIAVTNLPELIVYAAGKGSFGVMIARGDLAVQIGYQRLTEIQEEMLWICEAAHIPVIWATQVLENLVKDGIPSRGEMSDVAMSERAECVMLNKGPFITEAIGILDDVLTRMETHQLKKTPQLWALHSW